MLDLIFQQSDGLDSEFNIISASFMVETQKPVLYVEGDSDKEIIISIFSWFHDDQVLISGDKETVKECVKTAIEDSRGNKELYRGLVDCDIEPYRPKKGDYPYEDCLFYTDTRDMETLLWSTYDDLFRQLLVKGGLRKDCKYIKNDQWKSIYSKLLEAAYRLGIIRLIIEDSVYSSSRIGIKVNQDKDNRGRPIPGFSSPYRSYDYINMEMDIDKLINEHLCVTSVARNYKYEIEDKYEEEYKKRKKELWHIIRGHDLSNIVMMTLNMWRIVKWKDETDFESTLHQLYNEDKINKTELAKNIRSWIASFMQATA